MGAQVPRIGRVLDAVGLVIFVIGGGVFVRAWIGFQSVPDFRRSPADVPTAAVQYADGFWRLQHIGVSLMIVGVCIFAVAWFVARRRADSEMP